MRTRQASFFSSDDDVEIGRVEELVSKERKTLCESEENDEMGDSGEEDTLGVSKKVKNPARIAWIERQRDILANMMETAHNASFEEKGKNGVPAVGTHKRRHKLHTKDGEGASDIGCMTNKSPARQISLSTSIATRGSSRKAEQSRLWNVEYTDKKQRTSSVSYRKSRNMLFHSDDQSAGREQADEDHYYTRSQDKGEDDGFVRRSSRARRQKYTNLDDRVLKIISSPSTYGAEQHDDVNTDDESNGGHEHDEHSEEIRLDSEPDLEEIPIHIPVLRGRRSSGGSYVNSSPYKPVGAARSRGIHIRTGNGNTSGLASKHSHPGGRRRSSRVQIREAEADESAQESDSENDDDDLDESDEDVDEILRSARRPGLRTRITKRQDPYSRIVKEPMRRMTPKKKQKTQVQDREKELSKYVPKKSVFSQPRELTDGTLEPSNRKYFFRNTIPSVDRFKPPTPSKVRAASKGINGLFYEPPPQRSGSSRKRRRDTTTMNDQSASSSDDHRDFDARQNRSIMRARKEFMPLNMSSEYVERVSKARGRHNATALADIEPMETDKEVGFADIGGLESTIDTLKEMVIFPLLYPEFYDHFKVKSARGILLHGPPGTGKTLIARALANECSKVGGQKVAFFMRKGSDCLSKWVGESERQLRLLFDQAYLLRPSVIFFDEIDGLAPIRSTRQDQIHSSIVSTLLALMDGLDDRGQVIVVGATNRLDTIDPALRRPGRFDREFLFSHPNQRTRREILKIHTRNWDPPLSNELLAHLSQSTAGYCGADLKALVASSAMHSLKSKYPQIYTSNGKLKIDVESLEVNNTCFNHALRDIQPSANRSNEAHARALCADMRPILSRIVNELHQMVRVSQLPNHHASGHPLWSGIVDRTNARMLISGSKGMGQSKHLAPALMYELEIQPIYTLSVESLLSMGGAGAGTFATPEEACVNVLREAYKAKHALLYLPRVDQWWAWASPVLKQLFMTMLDDAPPASSLFLLATCDAGSMAVPMECAQHFFPSSNQRFVVEPPFKHEEVSHFFADLKAISLAPVYMTNGQTDVHEPLPLAEPNVLVRNNGIAVELDRGETRRMKKRVDMVQRELRIVLRAFTEKLLKERKFLLFANAVDVERNPQYSNVVTTPMDLSLVLERIDERKYELPNQWLSDVDLIVTNCKKYLPANHDVLRRAYALQDKAHTLIDELDDEFVKLCEETTKDRRHFDSNGDNYTSKTTAAQMNHVHSTPPRAERTSLRVRGLEPQIGLEDAIILIDQPIRTDSKASVFNVDFKHKDSQSKEIAEDSGTSEGMGMSVDVDVVNMNVNASIEDMNVDASMRKGIAEPTDQLVFSGQGEDVGEDSRCTGTSNDKLDASTTLKTVKAVEVGSDGGVCMTKTLDICTKITQATENSSTVTFSPNGDRKLLTTISPHNLDVAMKENKGEDQGSNARDVCVGEMEGSTSNGMTSVSGIFNQDGEVDGVVRKTQALTNTAKADKEDKRNNKVEHKNECMLALQAAHFEDWEDWIKVDTPKLVVDVDGVDKFFHSLVLNCMGMSTTHLESVRASLIRVIARYINEYDRSNMVSEMRDCSDI
eukprot:CFRG0484T1